MFNFGPKDKKNYKVIFVVKLMRKFWSKVRWKILNKKKNVFYESTLLKLNVSKAKKRLKWKSILTINQTIKMVIEWYKNYYMSSKKIYKTSLSQIKLYEKLLEKKN